MGVSGLVDSESSSTGVEVSDVPYRNDSVTSAFTLFCISFSGIRVTPSK